MGPMNRDPWQSDDVLEAFRRERPGAGARARNWEALERRIASGGRRTPGLRVVADAPADDERGEPEQAASERRAGRNRRREPEQASEPQPSRRSEHDADEQRAGTNVRLVAVAVAMTLAIAAAVLLVIGGIGRGLQAARQHAEPAMQAVDEPAAAPPLELVPRRTGAAKPAAAEPDSSTTPLPSRSPTPASDRSTSTPTREPTQAPATPSAAVSPEALAEQTRLLARARQVLAEGDPAAAIELLDQLGERYPSGALEPERRAYDAIARCRLDPPSRDAAVRFLADHPASPHAPRVRAACDANAPRPRE